MISQSVPVCIIQLENCFAVNCSLDITWHNHKWNSQFVFSKCWSIGTFNGGTGIKHFWDICITGSVYPPPYFSKFTWTLISQHAEVNKHLDMRRAKVQQHCPAFYSCLTFYGSWGFILMFTRFHHLSIFRARGILTVPAKHFSIVFPSLHRSCRWSLPFRFLHQYHVCLFLPSHVPHAQPISSSLIWSRE